MRAPASRGRYEANLARPAPRTARDAPSVEARIWAAGERPKVLALAPTAALATPNASTHLEQVVTPLLLGALASGRVPALPRLPCGSRGPAPWLVWHGGFKVAARGYPDARWAAAPGEPYTHGLCRTGSCGIWWVATGATDAAERAAAPARASTGEHAARSAGAHAARGAAAAPSSSS